MKGDKKEAYITTNDGVRIAYERFGSEEGPIVVLLHGACRCQIGYDNVARQSVHCNVPFFLNSVVFPEQAGVAHGTTTIEMRTCAQSSLCSAPDLLA